MAINGSEISVDEPEDRAKSTDGRLLFDVAECGTFGNPVIAVIGAADDEREKYCEIRQNSSLSSLGAADQVEFLASAIAELRVMLDEAMKAGKLKPV